MRDQPYSEHLRLYPSVNEGDVTTHKQHIQFRYVTERNLKQYFDRGANEARNTPGQRITASAT